MGSIDSYGTYIYDINMPLKFMENSLPILDITYPEFAIYVLNLDKKVAKIDGITCYEGYNSPTFKFGEFHSVNGTIWLITDYIKPSRSNNYKAFVIPLGFVSNSNLYYNSLIMNTYTINSDIYYLKISNTTDSRIINDYYNNSANYNSLKQIPCKEKAV